MLTLEDKVKLMALAVQYVNAQGKGNWVQTYRTMLKELGVVKWGEGEKDKETGEEITTCECDSCTRRAKAEDRQGRTQLGGRN